MKVQHVKVSHGNESCVFFQSVNGNSGETFDQESNGGSAGTQISGEAADGPEQMQGKTPDFCLQMVVKAVALWVFMFVSGVTTSTSELEKPQSEPSAEHEETSADGYSAATVALKKKNQRLSQSALI